ncbi:unnamed protein product [Boreogadus saida]
MVEISPLKDTCGTGETLLVSNPQGPVDRTHSRVSSRPDPASERDLDDGLETRRLENNARPPRRPDYATTTDVRARTKVPDCGQSSCSAQQPVCQMGAEHVAPQSGNAATGAKNRRGGRKCQITAEPAAPRGQERELELLPPPPKQKITDEEGSTTTAEEEGGTSVPQYIRVTEGWLFVF